MIRLGASPKGWIDLLPGVRARFDPISRPMVRAARRAAAAALEQGEMRDATGLDPAVLDEYDQTAAAVLANERRAEAGDAFTAELIRRGLREWDGVCDVSGEPLEITAETIDQFIAEPLLLEAVDALWVMPWALQASEKNVSSPLPAGTSAAATGAQTIVGSAAARGKTRSVKAGHVAKGARTASTRRRQKQVTGSGR